MTDSSVVLYVLPAGAGLPSLSPFCAKSAIYLKLAGIDHQVKIGNPQQAPKGKLPYLKHERGLLGDSGYIEEWCKERFGDKLDAHLTPQQRGQGHLVRRTCEEHFYWSAHYSRWIDPAGWEPFAPHLRSILPAPARPFLPALLRRGIRKSLHAQGLGRHDPASIYAAGCADIDAFASAVEATPGPFLFAGDSPTSFDIILYSFLGLVVGFPNVNKLNERIRSHDSLNTLLDEVRARYEAA